MDDIERCYEILELKPGASLEEMKQAWRDLVQVWHPDRFSENVRLRDKAQEKLKEVNEAYHVLKDLQSGSGRASSTRRSRRAPPRWERTHSHEDMGSDAETILRQGVTTWNLWRKKYSDITPNLQGAALRKADLSGADLRETDLSGAKLHGADLYKADLSGACLRQAMLSEADVSRARLVDTDLSGADLAGADLSGADLSGASLAKANLARVNLVGAILEAADLAASVALTREQIAVTLRDSETRLPAHL